MTSPPPYTSHLSIPYTAHHPLQTLDLHIPTTPPPSPTYLILFIHGGAFRDPLITSQSLLPALPYLLPSANIAAVASVNYRLSAYPGQEGDGDAGERVRWPDYVRDVRAALRWILGREVGRREEEAGFDAGVIEGVVLVGHSVGATIAFALMLGLDLHSSYNEDRADGDGDEREEVTKIGKKVKAVVGIEGIYDFTALRDAHMEHRRIYEDFTSAAFGAEEDGGWERGNIARLVKEGRELGKGVEVVVLGQSKGDELVEWRQVEIMEEALRGRGWRKRRSGGEEEGKNKGKEVQVVELKGGHDEIWTKGEELARCILVVVEACASRKA
ncbi:MAG: hypothetical protein Q9220_003441 [cf. Caloplaca sp. 1 TL-2023]